MCQIRVLSSRNQAVISHCVHCGMMLIWHHNILLNFSPDDFHSFRKMFSRLDFEECCVGFGDGKERAVIRTPNADICFSFSQDEWDDMRAAMDEAVYMRNVYDLMQGK